MIRFQIAFGNICFSINCNSRTTKDYFSDFLVNERESGIPISVEPKDVLTEWQKSSGYDGDDESVRRIWYEPMFEKLAISRKINNVVSSFSAIIMHGVVISDGNNAYMFTAPSGTGKTTRAKLFVDKHQEYFILNGDKPIVRLENDYVIACGSPWKGKEGYGTNMEAQLKAIFLLERAQQTEIIPISFSDAFDSLFQEVFIPSEGGTLRTLQILKTIGNRVKLFRFMSPCTVEAMEAAIEAASQQ